MKNFSIKRRQFQTTIKKPFVIRGKSSLREKNIVLHFFPAEGDTGIVFETEKGRVKASYKNKRECKEHKNTTEIASGKARVTTTEHILSAVYGLGIDNLTIKLKGDSGIPVFDSSSKKFTEEILKVGIKKIKKSKKIYKIENNFVVGSKECDSKAFIFPSKKFKVRVIIDFPSVVGLQTETFVFGETDYYNKISCARSFLSKPFEKNRWDEIRRTIKVLPKDPKKSDIVVYDEEKFLVKLRYKNEQAKHKLLDFLGDFSLIEERILAEIIVYKPGHSFNFEIVKFLAKEFLESASVQK